MVEREIVDEAFRYGSSSNLRVGESSLFSSSLFGRTPEREFCDHSGDLRESRQKENKMELAATGGDTASREGCWDLIEINCDALEVQNPEWSPILSGPQVLRSEKETNWEESSLAKFSKLLGFSIEVLEREILDFLSKIRKRREMIHSKGLLEKSKFERELKRLECSVKYKGKDKKNNHLKGWGDSLDWRTLEAAGAAGVWVFTGVYGPFTKEDRECLCDELGAVRGLWVIQWCVGGDFNVILAQEDRSRTSEELVAGDVACGLLGPSGSERRNFPERKKRKKAMLSGLANKRRTCGAAIHGRGGPFGPNGHEWGQGSRSGWLYRSLLAILLEFVKEKEERGAGDFRTISLLGGLYKLLAKVLANRIKNGLVEWSLQTRTLCHGAVEGGASLDVESRAASGLRINLAKSENYSSGEVDEILEMAVELGCKVGRKRHQNQVFGRTLGVGCGAGPEVPSTLQCGCPKECHCGGFMDQNSGQGGWNLRFIIGFNDWELTLVDELLQNSKEPKNYLGGGLWPYGGGKKWEV
ncbi:hypothetical protein CK203_048084 [Vitis vinifera]|uniref:DUF4283 domain-containing protein n=1 Tax=Vitis vinifera TaxID=29760 RepID=A0A438GYW0_VITVI|nr:hypothetical protein CK203_048084 [Vitis vinifera]